MPISGTTTDYTGRTKDMHIFQGVDPAKPAKITLEFGKVSNFCTGVQKLVQGFAICMLTELGSQESYPTFGSNMLSRLHNRNLSLNKADLFPIFNLACIKVINEFRLYQTQNPGLPEDEQLNTALLENIFVTADSIQLQVRIYPVAAEPVQFVIPLPK
jgi:hypothetical protein